MTRPRVVLDTNVIVSAALASQREPVAQGRPSLCLQLALNGLVEPALSPDLPAEYEAVLLRPVGRREASCPACGPTRCFAPVILDPNPAGDSASRARVKSPD